MIGWSHFLALSACTSGAFSPSDEPRPVESEDAVTGTGDDTAAPVDLPSDYSGPSGVGNPETVELSVVEAAVNDAIARARTYSSEPALAAFHIVMNSARPECPSMNQTESGVYWRDTCTTDDGTDFRGYLNWTQETTATAVRDLMFANATVDTATGHNYVNAAIVANTQSVQPNGSRPFTQYTSGVVGAYFWNGPGVAGTWLEEGIEPTIALTFTDYDDGAREGTASGTVPVVGGEIQAVAYGDLTIRNAASDAECTEDPEGTISVRDLDGNWYDVTFDGGVEVDDMSACDGCGRVTWRGLLLGEICPDLDPWFDWSRTPW